jgi:hypothetical protein
MVPAKANNLVRVLMGEENVRAWSRRPRGGLDPVDMPRAVPEVFQFGQLNMPVGKPHVDGPGQWGSGGNARWRFGGADASMPVNRASSHLAFETLPEGHSAFVKIPCGSITLQRPLVDPVLVEEHRGLGRLLDAGIPAENKLGPEAGIKWNLGKSGAS